MTRAWPSRIVSDLPTYTLMSENRAPPADLFGQHCFSAVGLLVFLILQLTQ